MFILKYIIKVVILKQTLFNFLFLLFRRGNWVVLYVLKKINSFLTPERSQKTFTIDPVK